MRALCTPRPGLTSIPALPRLPTNPGWSSVSCVSDQRSAPAGTQRQVTTISLAGFASAVIFFCLSLTPSLLPRDWLLQGLLSGVLAAIAYGIGVFTGFGARKVLPRVRSVAIDRLAWRAVALGSVVLVALFLYLGAAWQHEIRRLVGESQPTRYRYVLILLVAVALSAILVAIARLLRRLTRWVDQRLDRWLPIGVADVLGALVVALLVFGFIHGVVYDTLIAAANHAFKIINAETVPGDLPPVAPERSGSPASLVSWASLGNKGRDYIAGGPTPDQLQAFSGEPAQRPIRVYVGLESAPTLDTEAALAVRELQRVNGFSRTVLCVVTTTGTGHIDPNAVDALEYMYDGHTAIVSMQYSYLPSWISFLVDRRRAEEAGRELFNAVYAVWSQLPRETRPKLLVFGESLGAFGGEAAFSGTDDLRNRTDGVLWEGPPNDSFVWRELERKRDPGTPEIKPVYQKGVTVRFGARAEDLERPAGTWTLPRVVYLQHASDAVVWWSWRLVLHHPDWLKEPRGADVLPAMRWYPFVTFWQLGADMVFSMKAPPGHGHNYGGEPAGAWALIAPPEGWTPEKTARLVELLARDRTSMGPAANN